MKKIVGLSKAVVLRQDDAKRNNVALVSIAELSCPITLQLMLNPWVLSCGHSVSKEGLIKICGEDFTKEFSCPCCRSKVKAISENYHLKSIVNTAQITDEASRETFSYNFGDDTTVLESHLKLISTLHDKSLPYSDKLEAADRLIEEYPNVILLRQYRSQIHFQLNHLNLALLDINFCVLHLSKNDPFYPHVSLFQKALVNKLKKP